MAMTITAKTSPRAAGMFWVLCLSVLAGQCQAVEELNADGARCVKTNWNAYWITHPDIALSEHNVVHFRRCFELAEKPQSFIVHVSADNKYEIYVNGHFVCTGPARADLQHWRYETVDLAPFLQKGKNVIAAMVVNWGPERMKAQFSSMTAFFLSGHGETERIVNTDDDGWKVFWNRAYSPNPVRWMYAVDIAGGWYCANPMDRIDGSLYPWGWEEVDYDDSGWVGAKWLAHPASRGTPGHSDWLFVPRTIKLLKHEREQVGNVVRTQGVEIERGVFDGNVAVQIPANTKASILIDHKVETIGYPQIMVSGGKGSEIRLGYAECLFDKDRNKGNRNQIEGKQFIGYRDIILPDGGKGRLYRPTWHRAFRFLQLDIETADEPLVIDEFCNIYTSYPVKDKGRFECDDARFARIWDVCGRTVKVCAQDMLMSDAYYETMQYIYDTRIHGLTLFCVTGDTALWREAIRHYDDSRIPEGLALAAYPNNWHWIIPIFSLCWANMIYDYTMVTGDKDFAREFVPGVRIMFGWFNEQINQRGLLGRLKWANPNGAEENSSRFTLYYAYTLRNIADVWDYIGLKDEAGQYRALAKKLGRNVYEQCFVSEKGLIAESPEKKEFSDMTNVLAVLTETLPKKMHKDVLLKHQEVGFPDEYYLMEAIDKAGLGDRFVELLAPWDKVVAEGLSTCPEDMSDKPRSDCHPWSTSAVIYYFRTVCGIEPTEPGFSKVRIAPALGQLEYVKASLPTPRGAIKVELTRKGKTGLAGRIGLPKDVTGVFVWNKSKVKLRGGLQEVDVP
jgi:alpha-L-rhamnosidase